MALLCAATVTGLGVAPAAAAPSDRLDLRGWKIQLPVDEDGKAGPDEVTDLTGYELPPWFHDDYSAGVAFRADVTGVTTSGSDYPRSELREMDGSRGAAWGPGDDSLQHVMIVTQAITQVPGVRPNIVAGQIHGGDGDSDVLQVRLEGSRLFVDLEGRSGGVTLTSTYVLGTPFTVRIVATPSGISVDYNGARKVTDHVPPDRSGWYFKAGAYPQANETNGTGHGEVVITRLSVEHGPVPPPPPPPVYCAGHVATQVGTGNGEVIYGTAGNDVIAAGGGNDLVFGLGGDDIICGGAGNDILKAGAGDRDQLHGEDGADKLVGGAGKRDLCVGGPARDRAKGCEVRRSI